MKKKISTYLALMSITGFFALALSMQSDPHMVENPPTDDKDILNLWTELYHIERQQSAFSFDQTAEYTACAAYNKNHKAGNAITINPFYNTLSFQAENGQSITASYKQYPKMPENNKPDNVFAYALRALTP